MTKFNEIAEKCVKGELSGTFILKNGGRLRSNRLHKSSVKDHFYFNVVPGIYNYGLCNDPFYKNSTLPQYDVIDFIPDLMNKKEIKIEIPEGYEIDKENSTFEKIVFKPKDKDNFPRSWVEYCSMQNGFDGAGISWQHDGVTTTGLHHKGKAIVPTRLARPFIAYMQLMAIREVWIGNWRPDFNNTLVVKYCIESWKEEISTEQYLSTSRALSFPTNEMAEEFLKCFKDLLEEARELF